MKLDSLTLPPLGEDPKLSVVGERILVSDTDNTTFKGGRVGGRCAAATIAAASLRVETIAYGSCGDPALFGQHAIPIVYALSKANHAGWGVNALAIRISTLDQSPQSGYRVGPIIVTYPDGSDMRAEMTEGDGSLWIYTPLVGSHLRNGELLRVSLATGRVAERWKMPPITRALLATNKHGLWLAPSNESGFSEHATAAEKVAQGSLYHVTPGLPQPVRVFDVGAWGARWLVASGNEVWLARGRASRSPALWRFQGAGATRTLDGASTSGGIQDCGDLGDGPVTVMGSAGGILCVSNPNMNTERVQWLSAAGGHSTVVANVSTSGEWEFVDNAVIDKGAYFFVEPTERDSPEVGKPVIYRIAPQ